MSSRFTRSGVLVEKAAQRCDSAAKTLRRCAGDASDVAEELVELIEALLARSQHAVRGRCALPNVPRFASQHSLNVPRLVAAPRPHAVQRHRAQLPFQAGLRLRFAAFHTSGIRTGWPAAGHPSCQPPKISSRSIGRDLDSARDTCSRAKSYRVNSTWLPAAAASGSSCFAPMHQLTTRSSTV